MRKSIVISVLLAGSLRAHAQGTLNFFDRQSDMTIHIYVSGSGTHVEEFGNSTGDIYAYNGVDANVFNNPNSNANGPVSAMNPILNYGGSTVYTGGLIGAPTTPPGGYNFNNGSDYTVQLYAAPGLNAAASALLPVSQYVSTIYTSSTLGGTFRSVIPANDPGIPNATTTATIALMAWYNGGTGLTLAQAKAANDPWGESLLANFGSLYTGPPSPPYDMQGLQSFSIVGPQLPPIPEPGTIALGLIGASAFLFCRRNDRGLAIVF